MNKKLKICFLFLLNIFCLEFYSQQDNVRVNIDKQGLPIAGGINVLVIMPLYYTSRKNWFYCEIPSKFFWKNQLEDTVCLLIKKKTNNEIPKRIKHLKKENKLSKVNYNSESGEIDVLDGSIHVKYHFYDISSASKYFFENSTRKNVRMYDKKQGMTLADSSWWYGVGREYLRYGLFDVNNKTYSISLGDKTLDRYFGNGFDKISIDALTGTRHYANNNARCDDMVKTKYLDFEGEHYKIIKIDSNGKFIDLEKVELVNPESTIYIDTIIRDFKFPSGDQLISIKSLHTKDKYLVVSVVSGDTPSYINDISVLNGLKLKYGDKINILYLYEGDSSDLEKIKTEYNMTFNTGMLTEELKKDLMVLGYPQRLIISSDGIILNQGTPLRLNLEKNLSKILE